MSDEKRFFVEHGTIHDRDTGKHVDADVEIPGGADDAAIARIAWGGVVRLGAMLRNIDVERDALRAQLASAQQHLESDRARIAGLERTVNELTASEAVAHRMIGEQEIRLRMINAARDEACGLLLDRLDDSNYNVKTRARVDELRKVGT